MIPNVVLRMDDYWRETESLGKYSNISARIWIHKYSPLQNFVSHRFGEGIEKTIKSSLLVEFEQSTQTLAQKISDKNVMEWV